MIRILGLLFCLSFLSFVYWHRPEVIEVDSKSSIKLDSAIQFIHADEFLKRGITGKNVKVGIIDVGFAHAPEDPSLSYLFKKGRVQMMRDFVDRSNKDFFEMRSDMDRHGTMVMKYLAGKDEDTQYGIATDALFYLARTDDATREYRKEQEYFKDALEWMHNAGVRLVNVSLGYGYGFDDPAENYTPQEMDGVTSMISTAVREFAQKYDMIIVTSMGNDGDNPWRIQTAPADVKEAVSVGLVDKHMRKVAISAEGADFLLSVKPDITCFNNVGGTSFAVPVITGLIAGMLQQNNSLSCAEIMTMIHKAGHLYPFGNNYLGYGVPDSRKIIAMLEGRDFKDEKGMNLETPMNEFILGADSCGSSVLLFHKKDHWSVLKQEILLPEDDKFFIRRPEDIFRQILIVDDKVKQKFHLEKRSSPVKRTTVVYNNNTLEIEWK